MKLLFADAFPTAHIERLETLGHTCRVDPGLGAEDLPDATGDAEILIVRSTLVTAETIDRAGNLKMVIRAGAGTNTIDKDAAAASNVYVCNVPGKNAIAVAELVMGLLLSLDRNIPDNVARLRAGEWDKKTFSETLGLYGRRIGIVGMGAIGMAVAERARAFGMPIHVIAKPGRDVETQARLKALDVIEAPDLQTLAADCDILTFHLPAAPETKHLVNAELLALMKPGGIILNTSRGDLVDEAALIAAMDEKKIRAGLDVYANEPGGSQGTFDSPLARHPNVYGTHHIGASTAQAQNAVAEGVVDIIEAYTRGNVMFCVNGLI